jgi:hypothetical protein
MACVYITPAPMAAIIGTALIIVMIGEDILIALFTISLVFIATKSI